MTEETNKAKSAGHTSATKATLARKHDEIAAIFAALDARKKEIGYD